MSRYYDNHTLFVETGVATEEQLSISLNLAIKEVEKKLGKKFPCCYKINLIQKNGTYCGIGYIRVTNPEIYWMLTGRNPNGTPRIKEYVDPTWEKNNENNENNEECESWAEIAENEEAPIIREEYEPLMKLPGYKYNKKQIEHLRKSKPNEKITKMGYFKIGRAYSNSVKSDRIENILYSRYVPEWIPNSVFKNIFKKYVTDKDIKLQMENDKGSVPLIIRYSGRRNKKGERMDTVYIIFDPKTHDGAFARIMQLKTKIVHPKNKNLSNEILFDYAYKSDRNLIGKNVQVLNNGNIKQSQTVKYVGKHCLYCGYKYIIQKFIHENKIQIMNEKDGKVMWVKLIDIELFE